MSGADDPDKNRTVFRPSPLGRREAVPAPPLHNPQGAPQTPPPGYPQPAYPPQQAAPPGAMPTPSGFAPPSSTGFAPAPGGAPSYPQPAQAAVRRAAPDDDIAEPAIERIPRNVLVDGAARFLAFAAGVRAGRARPDLERLRIQAEAEISAYSETLRKAGVPQETAQRAVYAVCSTIDDIVQNLPAAQSHDWARRSMAVRFFQQNIAGDQFWALLDSLLTRPDQHKDLLELFYACLAAGFEGRFRVEPGGRRLLDDKMSRIFTAVRVSHEVGARELSPQWAGTPVAAPRFGPFLPALIAAAAIALVAVAVFVGLRLALTARSGDIEKVLVAPFPKEPLQLARFATPPIVPDSSTQVDRVTACLGALVTAGVTEVVQDANFVTVRTKQGNLFPSNSDVLQGESLKAIQAIGGCMDREAGPIRIDGHSDSDRVGSGKFADNQELSQARAEAAKQAISGIVQDAGRITAQGYGDSIPIADNNSAEGKARNRRVEFVLSRER